MIINTQEPKFKPFSIFIEEKYEAIEIIEFIKNSKVHDPPQTINYLYDKIIEIIKPIKKKQTKKNAKETCPYQYEFGEDFNMFYECLECSISNLCEKELERIEEDE